MNKEAVGKLDNFVTKKGRSRLGKARELQPELQRQIDQDDYWDNHMAAPFGDKYQVYYVERGAIASTQSGMNVEIMAHESMEENAETVLRKKIVGARNYFKSFEIVDRGKTALREMGFFRTYGFIPLFANMVADEYGLSDKKREELITYSSQGKFRLYIPVLRSR